jgi:hypothetical protein
MDHRDLFWPQGTFGNLLHSYPWPSGYASIECVSSLEGHSNGSCSPGPFLRRPWKLGAYFLASPLLEVYLAYLFFPHTFVFVSEVPALNGRTRPVILVSLEVLSSCHL